MARNACKSLMLIGRVGTCSWFIALLPFPPLPIVPGHSFRPHTSSPYSAVPCLPRRNQFMPRYHRQPIQGLPGRRLFLCNPLSQPGDLTLPCRLLHVSVLSLK